MRGLVQLSSSVYSKLSSSPFASPGSWPGTTSRAARWAASIFLARDGAFIDIQELDFSRPILYNLIG